MFSGPQQGAASALPETSISRGIITAMPKAVSEPEKGFCKLISANCECEEQSQEDVVFGFKLLAERCSDIIIPLTGLLYQDSFNTLLTILLNSSLTGRTKMSTPQSLVKKIHGKKY
jgi:hypothetical protein